MNEKMVQENSGQSYKVQPEHDSILIVDDMEINRIILTEIFKDDFQILEAADGQEAMDMLDQYEDRLACVLLDVIMPIMDGIQVLEEMKQRNLIKKIPVFLITAENSWKVLQKAYDLGVRDIIEKPFVPNFLKRRIDNLLYLDQVMKSQDATIDKQMKKIRELNYALMESLAMAIEFRNCESGEHVQRIKDLTELFGRRLCEMYPELGIDLEQLPMIAEAAVLHDVGKIAIPDAILNKPARLTREEFEKMKLHTVKGCDFLDDIPHLKEEKIYQYAYDICRWHHERCDGNGYPDGLREEEIPIWAQIVGLADVYDALVSPRVYKPAYSHEKARNMIMHDECGVFSDKLLACMMKYQDEMRAFYLSPEEEDPGVDEWDE